MLPLAPAFGKAVIDGEIQYLSVSQITTFDPDQTGGCNRRWHLEKVIGLKTPSTQALDTGLDVHKQIENTIKTGVNSLGKIARTAQRFLPSHDDVVAGRILVEQHFTKEGRELTADGIPLLGYIDVVNQTGRQIKDDGEHDQDPPHTIELLDWKTSSDIQRYAKQGRELVGTVQMPGYAEWAARRDPTLENFRLSHVYMPTRGSGEAVKRTAIIPLTVVKARWHKVESLVRSMRGVARETDPQKVDPNYNSCSAYRGCPFRYLCPRDTKQVLAGLFAASTSKENSMANLLDRLIEKSVVAGLGGLEAKAPQADQVVDRMAALKAEMIALESAEKAKALADAEAKAKALADAEAKAKALADAEAKAKALAKNGLDAILKAAPALVAVLPPDAPQPGETGPIAQPQLLDAKTALVAADAKITEKPRRKKKEDSEDGICLYIDAIPTIDFDYLDAYIAKAHLDLCESTKLPDIGLIEFGKGKAMLRALVTAAPPPAGKYVIFTSDVTAPVIDALIPLARLVVRGVRR